MPQSKTWPDTSLLQFVKHWLPFPPQPAILDKLNLLRPRTMENGFDSKPDGKLVKWIIESFILVKY